MTRPPTSSLSLTDLARDLRALADDLETGRLRIGSARVAVGQPTFLKAKSELKAGSAYFTIAAKMPLLETDSPAAGKPPEPPAPATKPRATGSSDAKRIKKELSRLWRATRSRIASAEPPDATDCRALLALGAEYRLFTEREWRQEWEDCLTALTLCTEAATTGNWPAATALAGEIDQRIKECHKRYK